MSAAVVIRQTGLFKKTLPLSIILGEKLSYGTFSGSKIQEDVISRKELILYEKDQIGRGISIQWSPSEKNEVTLRLLMVCSERELRSFFDCVGRIQAYWRGKILVEGQEIEMPLFASFFDEWLAKQIHALQDLVGKILDGSSDTLSFYCVRRPLTIGRLEAERFSKGNGLLAFAQWLHEKQMLDAHDVMPSFYKGESDIFGVYTLCTNEPAILPRRPYVPYGYQDPETGEMLQCTTFLLAFFSKQKNTVLAALSYAEGLKRIQAEKRQYFDGAHDYVESFSEEEMEACLNE